MDLSGNSNQTALIDGDNDVSVTYEELFGLVEARMRKLGLAPHAHSSGRRQLVFLSFLPTIDAVVDYLAVRAAGAPTVLLDPRTPTETLTELARRYQPTLVLRCPVPPLDYSPVDGSFDVFRPTFEVPPVELAEDVALLLPTSASTGNPKMVQLTEAGLNHNSQAICRALSIADDERGLACLPLFYSFGLAVLNSHLEAGATTVLTGLSPVQAGFWGLMGRHRVTSVPAVPYSFQMFRRVGMLDMRLPHLRYICQAGGFTPDATIEQFLDYLAATDKDLYLMYGQTEATARMSVLPAAEAAEHPRSVGYAIEDGAFRIDAPDNSGIGQVMYSGPNVMLGYASCREDVGARTASAELATGDLGRLDSGGRLTLTGRIGRSANVFGHRVDLDDVERILGLDVPAAAVASGERIHVFVSDDSSASSAGQNLPALGRWRGRPLEDSAADRAAKAVAELERRLEVPPRTILVTPLSDLPVTPSGKVDYRHLSEAAV